MTLNNQMNLSLNSEVISEKKMCRYVCGSPNEWPWMKGHRSAKHLILIQEDQEAPNRSPEFC